MFDPAVKAHLRILDNIQAAIHRLITELVQAQSLPPRFPLACRGWLLSQLRTLTLHQQAIVASAGLGRRVGLYDDILLALCQDRDLILHRAQGPDPALLLQALSGRLDEIQAILLDFTPSPGRSTPSAEATGLAHLLQLEAGPLSMPGALAGLVGWWTHLSGGTIALDLDTRRLSLGVPGDAVLVRVLADLAAPLRYLGGDIHVTWGHARGIVPRSGPPAIRLCDSASKACFVGLLGQVPALTVPAARDTAGPRSP
jgi:hypothetical protein